MGDTEVRPEHLLLGVMYEGDGVATAALASLGVGPDDLLDAILDQRSR